MATIPIPSDPNAPSRWWRYEDTYRGPDLPGRWVPNVNDGIDHRGVGWFTVTDVDPTTHLYTMIPAIYPPIGGVDEADRLLGVGPGYQSSSWRLRVDNTQFPIPARVDSRLYKKGSGNTHYKIFLGTDISDVSGIVISAYYNGSNVLISENIPLELVDTDNVTNVTNKTFGAGWVNRVLTDGEVVTVVTYSADLKTSVDTMLVSDGGWIRPISASQRYIRSVYIESAFMSPTEDDTLLVPSNTQVANLGIVAYVHYSDGTRALAPIDGTKVRLIGLDNQITSVPGQTRPFELVYTLAANEYAEDPVSNQTRAMTSSYQLRTQAIVMGYDVKLYAIPRWTNPASGWRLDYYLFDLNRSDRFIATNHVVPAPNSEPFRPLLYGTTQRLVVDVDLSAVDARSTPHIHRQTFEVTLFANGDTSGTAWTLQYNPGLSPEYGRNLSAPITRVVGQPWEISLQNGLPNLTEWLQALYYNGLPLVNNSIEPAAPVPTHFDLTVNNVTVRYPIASWNQTLYTNSVSATGTALVITWLRQVGGQFLYLSASPLRIRQIV